METKLYLRILRRVSTVVLALLLLLFMSTPVLADTAEAVRDDFAAVSAQLEAVARDEGQRIADRMLYASFMSPSAVPEAKAEPEAVSARRAPVVVHSAQQESLSFSGLLPFFVVVAAALLGLCGAAQHRRSLRNSRAVYAPVSSRPFRG